MSNGKFTLFKSRNDNQYYFNLRAENGEIILNSEGYKQHSSALAGIASVRISSQIDSCYERKESVAGYSFVLRSINNEIIGRGEVYETAAGRDNGIASVKRNAPSATLDDQTN